LNSFGVSSFTLMPRFSISLITSSIDRTTPLICGCQASVTMRTVLGCGIGGSVNGRQWVSRGACHGNPSR
jgi:hypothetical protein